MVLYLHQIGSKKPAGERRALTMGIAGRLYAPRYRFWELCVAQPPEANLGAFSAFDRYYATIDMSIVPEHCNCSRLRGRN